MKHTLILILLAILSTSAIYPQAIRSAANRIERVDEVVIRGNLRIPARDLQSLIRTKRGDELDPSEIDKDIHRLDATGHFESVKVMIENDPAGGKIVTFEVLESPLIYKVAFEGLSASEQANVRREWNKRHAEINVGDEYNPVRLREASRIIEVLLNRNRSQRAEVYCWVEEISAFKTNIRFSLAPISR